MKTLCLRSAAVLLSLLLPTIASATDWFVRSLSNSYGSGNGSSYNDAWNGFNSINWDSIQAGDTLYVCGVHDAGYLGDKKITVPQGKAGTETAPITIDGACPGDSGVINSTSIRIFFDTADLTNTGVSWMTWTEVYENNIPTGVYTVTGAGCTDSWILESGETEASRRSPLKLTRVQPILDFNRNLADPNRDAYNNWLLTHPDAELGSNTPSIAFADFPAGSFFQGHRECGGQRALYYKPSTAGRHYVFIVGDNSIELVRVSHIIVRNLIVFNTFTDWNSVNILESHGIQILDNTFYWSSHAAIGIRNGSTNGTIRGNHIHDTGNGIYFIEGWLYNSNWRIEDNHIHDIYMAKDSHCIGVGQGENIVIERNHLHHCSGTGITLYKKGDYKTQYCPPTVPYENCAQGTGGILVPAALLKNNTVRFNYIHDVLDGDDVDDNNNGRPYPGGRYPANDGHIQTGIDQGLDNCAQHPDDATGNVVAYNVVANAGGRGIYVKGGKPTTPGVYSWSFFNNVLYNVNDGLVWNAYPWYVVEDDDGISNCAQSLGPDADPNRIPELSNVGFRAQNNIIVNAQDNFIEAQWQDPDHSGIFLSNNLYFSTTGNYKFVWNAQTGEDLSQACASLGGTYNNGSCTVFSLAAFQTLSGRESGSIVADPLFLNPVGGDFHWTGTPVAIAGGGDFRPTIDSPAIDAGANVGLSADILGQPIQGSPDIGAYETGALADLGIAMTDTPDPVNTGGFLTYSVTVTNNGPSGATGVTATHTLAAGVTGSASPSQGSCTGSGAITCNLGNLGNGQSATITVTAIPSAEAIFDPTTTLSEAVTASASVTGNEIDRSPSNNSAAAFTTVQLACLGKVVTKRGTSGNDGTSSSRFAGGSGADVIHTLSGNDWIAGKGGIDTICGGAGDDNINGNGGADALSGGDGTDVCNGGSGTDTTDGSCETVNSIP